MKFQIMMNVRLALVIGTKLQVVVTCTTLQDHNSKYPNTRWRARRCDHLFINYYKKI